MVDFYDFGFFDVTNSFLTSDAEDHLITIILVWKQKQLNK